MGFGDAVRTVFKEKYATFSGRASRPEFWWFQLFYLLSALAFGAAIGLSMINYDGQTTPVLTIILGIIASIALLGTLLPLIALQVRRLHDRNMSGWWYLGIVIVGMIPFIGAIASIGLIVIDVLPGTQGANRFGPDPLRPQASAEVFA